MKVCSLCKIRRSLSKFKTYNGKHKSKCNRCTKLTTSRPYTLIRRIWINQVHSSYHRGHLHPDYTEKWLTNWLLDQEIFLILHNKWVINNCNIRIRPSVDRISDNIGYTKDNIQLMTWEENHIKSFYTRTTK